MNTRGPLAHVYEHEGTHVDADIYMGPLVHTTLRGNEKYED